MVALNGNDPLHFAQVALTKKAIERITTAFLGRNFDMLLAPGQIVFEDAGGSLVIPAENRGVRLDEVPPLRPRHMAKTQSLRLQISYIGSPAELLPRWCQSLPSTLNSNRS